MRIKTKDIPALRDKIAEEQGGMCGLCKVDLKTVVPCLDHDHTSGFIRGVLCQNCNGIEGKIFNLCRRAKRDGTPFKFLMNIMNYWEAYASVPRKEMHPTHKTQEEKKARRNKLARLRRKKLTSK